MRALFAIATAAAIAAIAVLVIRRRRREIAPAVSRQPRQTAREDAVVDEWGAASFPASDAPQSW